MQIPVLAPARENEKAADYDAVGALLPQVAAFQVLAASGNLTAGALGLKVKFYNPLDHYDRNATSWLGFGD